MKLRNIIISLMAFIPAIMGITVKAETTAPNSFTIAAKDLYMLHGSEYLPGSTIQFTYKVNTKGEVIYCTEIHDAMITSGTEKYNFSKELDAKYAYIIQNGYPNKSLFGDKNKDYFTTGLAIWYIISPNDTVFTNFNFEKGTYKGKTSDVANKIAELVNGANNYKYVEPTIKLNSKTNELTLSSDGKYYVSSSIGLTTTGNIKNSYTVSLDGAPKGTIITDVNGNEKNSFGTNESFLVKVPVSSISGTTLNFKINANATGSINKAYLYTPSNSQYQSTAVLYPENKNVSSSINLKLDIITEVQISKTDATTSEELPGAHLVVKNSEGNIIDEWTSTNEVHVIKGLQPGKYTLTETIAPEGYKLSTETITFEVKNDGTVTKVVMKNYPEDKPVPIEISKQDITTGEELPGAHLELKDEKGEVIYAWVSDSVPFIIKDGLKPGKYTLTETIAPDGYELSTETVEFIVKEDGTVDGNIIMYNKPEIVEVPSTSSFKTMTASLIGIIIIGLGSLIVYRNYKKNEEN